MLFVLADAVDLVWREKIRRGNEMSGMRINKYMSQCGFCSRREADRLIAEGKVLVNGVSAEMGQRVEPEDKITVGGEVLTVHEEELLIVLNKPQGIVCTTSKKEKNNVIDFLQFPERVYPVGRLDKDSTGLLLLTNNGQLMDDILRGRNFHEKEYIVKVNKPITDSVLSAMGQGVPILDTMTRPCRVQRSGADTFHIILTQGLNRQIRRMCEYFGYRVVTLKRVRIMNLELGDLPEGQWRFLSEKEIRTLKKLAGEKGGHCEK